MSSYKWCSNISQLMYIWTNSLYIFIISLRCTFVHKHLWVIQFYIFSLFMLYISCVLVLGFKRPYVTKLLHLPLFIIKRVLFNYQKLKIIFIKNSCFNKLIHLLYINFNNSDKCQNVNFFIISKNAFLLKYN